MRGNAVRQLLDRMAEFSSYFVILAVMALIWRVSVYFDGLETFFDFSRAHEDWELDEIATLILSASIGLSWALVLRSRQLKLTVRERDLAEREAVRLARHDPLTGLPNRRAFLDHVATVAAAIPETGPPLILMMLDLDRFKAINDLYGHACGDHVLDEVASRLERSLEEGDFVARLGGDEFAITLKQGTSVERAERVARRLTTAIAQPVVFRQTSVRIGTSVGLAQLQRDQAAALALHCADQALYAAKRTGRGEFAWYDQNLDRSARERTQLEQDLRMAVARDDITPYLQPIFNIATGQLIGFEALARWNHPTRGMISPEVFIEIAEDIGMISALGWSILRKACIAARPWDPALKLSVNFSPTQFRDPHLVDTVREILDSVGFDPRRLEVEITESAIMLDFELARASITRLRALGISLALDDFGTGFSSLSNLRKLPFDRIKIDRSFIMDIRHQPENQKIVTGILALARGLELSVTAEGIQNKEDLSFLQSMDCELGQGYLYSHPVAVDEANWLLETRWSDRPVAEALPLPPIASGAS